MISLDATCNRRVVRATIGDLLRIELPENAMAGNRWALPDPLPRELRLVLDKTTSGGHVIYSDGARRLEFRVVAPGAFALSLLSAHSWQPSCVRFELFIEAYDADADAVIDPASGPQ
jgi:hypothetical protein